MRTPRMLGRELKIDSREVRIAAEALGLGRWVNPKLFILEDEEVTKLRARLDQVLAERRTRSAKVRRSIATPAPSA